MGRLSTHVLDTANGCPAAGVRYTLRRKGEAAVIASGLTNADGRTDAPLLQGDALLPGVYELEFDAGAYFRARGTLLADIPFLDDVVLRFGIGDANAHYHVPLLVSPWAYSTYRGS
ncbi:hydroxyisourate hydrolase [Uliginosibacterium sp. H1]|uniref:hydroxyisourate hydrolase n=1 Tax=Uliginosibacterium sp. H1 TaxID=3114757 RepID=UPI002E18FC89|nr:hydroxyisourate hydrolase [Uliginosibacterium sp. H1]